MALVSPLPDIMSLNPACQESISRLKDDKSTLSVDYALIYPLIYMCVYIYIFHFAVLLFIEVQSLQKSQVYMQ